MDDDETDKKMLKAHLSLFAEPVFRTDDQETALQCLLQMGEGFVLQCDGSNYSILLRFRGADAVDLIHLSHKGIQTVLQAATDAHHQAVGKCDLVARTVKGVQEMRRRAERERIRMEEEVREEIRFGREFAPGPRGSR